jgi:hypothetical protein
VYHTVIEHGEPFLLKAYLLKVLILKYIKRIDTKHSRVPIYILVEKPNEMGIGMPL